MEETKLDKIVGKIFSVVENATSFLQDEPRKSKTHFRLNLMMFFFGIFFSIRYFIFSSDPNEPFILKVIAYLQGPMMIYVSLSYFYQRLKLISDIDLKILKFSQKLYSEETIKLCFEPIIADWKAEYSTSTSQNQFWQAHWISARYVYAFLAAMFQQSWLGRLFEFIQKIIK